MREEYSKICCICGINFKTIYNSKNVCSFSCKKEKARISASKIKRQKRQNIKNEPCIICGFYQTVDIHHEGSKIFVLCPNHHSLITRGIKTLEEQLFDKFKNKKTRKSHR